MAFLYGNILRDFEVVHGLEDGESLADGMDADVFQCGVVEMDEDVARDAVLCADRGQYPTPFRVDLVLVERTVQLLVIVRVAEVSPQLMDAVRVEREQVRGVGGIALALQIKHAQSRAREGGNREVDLLAAKKKNNVRQLCKALLTI